jgi:hypothetical protein
MSTDRWIATFNATNWRISTFNGALLAAYFVPTWTIVACKIAVSPVHGFYERPNISVALFLNDTLHVAAADLTRFAWLLALGRLTVAAFFIVFLVQITRPAMRKAGECDEALAIALGIGSLISFASMVMASQVGETAALRLHATEFLLLLGTAIVLLVERPTQPSVEIDPAAIARSTCDEAIQSLVTLDCFAEPVIGRRFVPTRWLAMTESYPFSSPNS